MYVIDAVYRAKELRPNEYTIEECLKWCDGLSADIMRNYDIKYQTLRYETNEVQLPQNVTIHDIAQIRIDGKLIPKTTLIDYGVDYKYTIDGIRFRMHDDSIKEFEIIYREPYFPIRYIDKDITVTFSDSENTFTLPEDIGLWVGDTVTIKSGDETVSLNITGIDGNTYAFAGTKPTASGSHIFRKIQEITLMPPPYDETYVDLICAKVSLYQGDTNSYSNFINEYNTKLSDYRRWLTRSMPREKQKIINWW